MSEDWSRVSLPEVVHFCQICVFFPQVRCYILFLFHLLCFYKGIVFYFVKILFYCIILIMYRVSRPYLRAAVCVMRGMALSLSRSLSVLWSSPTLGLVTGALSWAVCMLRAACMQTPCSIGLDRSKMVFVCVCVCVCVCVPYFFFLSIFSICLLWYWFIPERCRQGRCHTLLKFYDQNIYHICLPPPQVV